MSKKHYVDGALLHETLTKYRKALDEAKASGEKLPQVPEYVGYCIIQICEGVSRRPNFTRYTYRDEMVDDAKVGCVYGASMFDPTKANANAFNYFTTIAWQAMVQRIEKEKRQNYIKHRHLVNTCSGLDGSSIELDVVMNEASNHIIGEFEAKQAARKIKNAEKRRQKTLNLDE